MAQTNRQTDGHRNSKTESALLQSKSTPNERLSDFDVIFKIFLKRERNSFSLLGYKVAELNSFGGFLFMHASKNANIACI